MGPTMTGLRSDYRSVSQYNQFNRCAYAYKLDRIDKVWSRPAAWLSQGTAVHAAIEYWEKNNRECAIEWIHSIYTDSYAESVNNYSQSTPNFDWWFASGRYKGEEDIIRRYDLGWSQVTKYQLWADNHPDEVIWVAPDGTPGIELGFDIDLDGVMVKGFIDLVLDNPTGPVITRDLKTGNTPGDDFQLGVYGVALGVSFDIEFPNQGDYWMGKTGKPTIPYDISKWTKERVTEAFHDLDGKVKAGDFPPSPEPSKCRFCSVSFHCEYKIT